MGILRILSLLGLGGAFMGPSATFAQNRASNVKEYLQCSMAQNPASGDIGSITQQEAGFPRYTLMRIFLEESSKHIFRLKTENGTIYGRGKQREDKGWVVSNWTRAETAPPVTLMTFFPNQTILVSVATGPKSHVTYAGSCKPL